MSVSLKPFLHPSQRLGFFACGLAFVISGCGGTPPGAGDAAFNHPSEPAPGFEAPVDIEPVELSETEWRERLTPRQFAVLRGHGTERPYASPLLVNDRQGVYRCAGCGLPLFHSNQKYDSQTGWPSYWAPLHAEHLGTRMDRSLLTVRPEVHCARCGGHLGHVFNDGPPPTGLRYCINGDALVFEER